MTQKLRAALKKHPILEGLPSEAVDELLAASEHRHFRPGEFLTREGDPSRHYWLLCAGSAKVFYSSPDGLEVTVKIFHAPAAWAEMEILTGHGHIEDCVAVDHAHALALPRERFSQLLDDYPRFMRNVLVDTCARFLIAAQNEKALAFLPVKERLANLLLSYVRIYGVPVEDGTLIRIKLSQFDLANGLGTARRSVTRTVAAWQEAGILSKRGNSYVIHNLERLLSESSRNLIGIDWIAGTLVRDSTGVLPRRRP